MRLHSLFGSPRTMTATPMLSRDRNNPAEPINPLGRYCEVHQCERMLDEAPVVATTEPETFVDDFELQQAKRTCFPNSWRVLATFAPAQRGGWFSRGRKLRTVAVRYCESCRAAAEQWMSAHAG